MSRFYQKYLSGLTGSGKEKEDSNSMPTAVDPTAMSRSSTAGYRPISSGSSTGDATGPMRRVQITNKSENYNPDAKDLKTFAKPEASKRFLSRALRSHYLFEELSEEDMGRIIECMRPTFCSKTEIIIQEGTLGDLFFCLEEGTAEAVVEGVGPVVNYESGGCFGELALIYNSPRAASVVAKSECKLWALDLKTFRNILATTSSAKMVKRCGFLKKCAFLDPLDNEQIGKLAGALELVEFENGAQIVTQGEVGDNFYIIESGTVKCSQRKGTGASVELIELKAGSYFGEMALMLKDSRHATCVASGAVKCFVLSKEKFDLLLGNVQDILARQMRVRILQSVPILSRLSDKKLMKLANVMRVQSFNDGAFVIKHGEEGSRFYIINEGIVKATRPNKTGSTDELIRLGAHEYFGERALLTSEPRTANIIAVGYVECLVLERSSFQTLLTDVQEDLEQNIAMQGNAKEGGAEEEDEEAHGPSTSYSYNELEIMRTIGTGTFGRVKLVRHSPTGQVCALKCMNKAEVLESHQEKNIMTEKNLLFECSSSVFVLQLLQTFNKPNQIMMLMEFIQGGELWTYIYEKHNTVKRNKMGGFEMSAVKFYSANVILGFAHLHAKNIAYRDLKPENLLIDGNGYVKIIDFGFAKKIPYERNGSRHDKTYTLCGTPEYLAPEIVKSLGYDKGVDHWALGCLIYELFLGRTPFQADYTTKIFQNIVASNKTLNFPSGMDALHVALCKKLLNSNSAFRLGNLSGGVNDIINDPFFNDVDWEALKSRSIRAPYCPPIKSNSDASNFDDYEEEAHPSVYTGDQGLFEGF
jgi:cGMP-dependent protein kinase